jgi:hypothetical protein
VWARQIRQLRLTIPRSSALFVSCVSGAFLGGSQGGQVCPPPGYAQRSGQCPEIFFWAVFAIFSGLLKIILVLGIRVLVSMEYLKTLYILYSEW